MHENITDMFDKIEPDKTLKNKVMRRVEENEMKKSTIKRTGGMIIAAAAAAVIGTASVFAATPTGQEAIRNIISYFQNDKANEITSLAELEKYNEAIGTSDSKHGFTLTLDNVAADDNFVHVFYTIKSETPFVNDVNDTEITGPMIWADIVINGKFAGYMGNNSIEDGYAEDCKTLKMVQKLNISTQDIPDKFKLEIIATDNNANSDWNVDLSRFYSYDDDGMPDVVLTDDEKAKVLYVSADIDKSKIKVNTLTKHCNLPLWNDRLNLEKVIFSPFSNQLVIAADCTGLNSEETDNLVMSGDNFALYDENGVCLDVLNSGLMSKPNGITRNSFEFLKADINTEKLVLIPVKYIEKNEDSEIIWEDTGEYPIEFQVSEYGKVVVTDIRFKDGEIDIDYYKDGYAPYDPSFLLTDKNGDNCEPGGKLDCVMITDVHYETNTYTARYVYEDVDMRDDNAAAPESLKADKLKERLAHIGKFREDYYTLDFDKAVTVHLK